MAFMTNKKISFFFLVDYFFITYPRLLVETAIVHLLFVI